MRMTKEQKESIMKILDRRDYRSITIYEQSKPTDTVMVECMYQRQGSIILGIEPDGYCHS